MKPPYTLPQFAAPCPYICKSCLRSRHIYPRSARMFSTSSPLLKNPPQPPAAAYASLPSRRLISLSGPDSTHYLQGVITANISPSPSSSSTYKTSGFYTAFLNAQGRILNDVFIYPDLTTEAGKNGEGWLIEVDANEADKLAKHIKRYKLRAKFDVRVVSEGERVVWSVWKEEQEGWTAHGLAGDGEGKWSNGEVGCEDKRAPGMGRRAILHAGRKPEEDVEETLEDVYQVRRYLKGVPEGQNELIREAALPQESNIDFMGGIDYRKGCYVGQELTIRTHHTGVVRKRILPVILYGKEDSIPLALEYDPKKNFGVEAIPKETSMGRFEKRGRSAGKFLSGVGNIGLGLCRLEIMTDLQIQGEAGGYKEGDEFKLEWEVDGAPDMAKVKAFVPPWHLTK